MNRRSLIKSTLILGGFSFLNIPNIFSKDFLVQNSDKILENDDEKSLFNKIDLFNPLSNNYFFIDENDDSITIIADEYFIDGENDLVLDKNLNILCNQLTIGKNITAKGRNFQLLCQNLVIKSKSPITIDVSGKNGLDVTIPQEQVARNAGADGTNADNKSPDGKEYNINGGNGGNISLFIFENCKNENNDKFSLILNTSGGVGGKGEDGSDGLQGGVGLEGEPCVCNSTAASSGKPGLRGGSSGRGGLGGNGGNGGNLNLIPTTKSSVVNYENYKDNISAYCHGGKGGINGKSGKPGQGGDGGVGGYNCGEWSRPQGREGWTEVIHCVNGANNRSSRNPNFGPRGEYGLILENKEKSQIGSEGTYIVSKNIKISDSFKSNVHLYSLIELVIFKAELSFLKGNYQLALKNYKYSKELIEVYKTSYPESKSFSKLENKIIVSINNIKYGNNFWGYPANFVTLISYKDIERQLREQYVICKDIESDFKIKFKEINSNKSANIDFTTTIENLNKLNATINQTNIDISKKIKSLVNENSNLFNEYNSYQLKLAEAENSFQEAVARKNNECSFGKVIKIASAVISVARVVSGDVTAIQGAISNTTDVLKNNYNNYKNNSKSGDDLLTTLGVALGTNQKNNNIIDSVQSISEAVNSNVTKIGNDVNQTTEKVASIKKTLSKFHDDFLENEESKLPSNLIALSQADFEATIKPYVDDGMEEAIHFKEIVKNYLAICNKINQNKLNITSLIGIIFQNESEIAANSRASGKLNLQKIVNFNKLDPLTQIVITNSYFKFLYNLYYQFDLLSQALQYSLLDKKMFEIQTQNIESFYLKLIDSNVELLKNLDNTNPFSNATKARFSFDLVIKSCTNQECEDLEMLKFIKGDNNEHSFLFQFSHSNKNNISVFGGSDRYNHRVRDINIQIFGIKSEEDQQINVTLTHFGDSKFKTNNDEIIDLRHRKISYPITLNKINNDYFGITKDAVENNLNSTQENSIGRYSDLSPFATWKLNLRNDSLSNAQLNLSSISKIVIEFTYFAKIIS